MIRRWIYIAFIASLAVFGFVLFWILRSPSSQELSLGSFVESVSRLGIDPSSKYQLQVIPFSNSYIPAYLLYYAGTDNCPLPHWHAVGSVKMLNGQIVSDPRPQRCGYGTIGALTIPVDRAYLVGLYGASIERRLIFSGGEALTGIPAQRCIDKYGRNVDCPQ